MKKIMTIVMCIASACAFAGNGNKSNNVVAKATKSSVVYFYAKAGQHGIWYHVDSKCALKCKEYAVVEGKVMGISVTKENNAKHMGLLECPTCAAHHAVCKNAVAAK